MLVKISTDEGITGWGEPTLEGKATVVEEAVRIMGAGILSEDPMQVERLYQRMYRGGLLPGRRDSVQCHQRHRTGALGYQGEEVGRTRVAASGRQVS